jgi:hypothetical protein
MRSLNHGRSETGPLSLIAIIGCCVAIAIKAWNAQPPNCSLGFAILVVAIAVIVFLAILFIVFLFFGTIGHLIACRLCTLRKGNRVKITSGDNTGSYGTITKGRKFLSADIAHVRLDGSDVEITIGAASCQKVGWKSCWF